MPGMRRKVTFIKLKFFRIERRRRTHLTNEDLLNIKRKGDPEVSYPLSYNVCPIPLKPGTRV